LKELSGTADNDLLAARLFLGGVDRGLQECLHTLDPESDSLVQPAKDGGGFAVEKVELGQIDSNAGVEVDLNIRSNALEQQGIVKHHLTFDPQHRSLMFVIVDLGNMRRHNLHEALNDKMYGYGKK